MDFLRLALDEARKCTPSPTAFCVGCVLTASYPSDSSKPVILARGYSRELPGNTHAEANALTKARQLSQRELAELFPDAPHPVDIDTVLAHADIYTTMEPCSVRTSGLPPCADAIIAARIRRCFIGVGEPDDFVKCEGAQKLKDAGVDVVWLSGLEKECLEVARMGREQ
ncbi:cytidine deaminase-like protein [Trametes cingulata]|nr:cytidine deaminase-like protein [Trametes cingulata]